MRSEPSGSVPFRLRSPTLNRVPVGIDQHFAPADMVGLADQAVLFHPLDQASGAIVADAQLALEVGRRGLLAFGDDLDRLTVKLRLGVVLAGRLAVKKIAAVFGLLGDRLDVVRSTLLAPMLSHRAHFLIADERPVDADDLLAAWHVEHVATSEQ